MSVLPPVSLLILTYRQEEFVEAAIAGALAQDYANLQIVISDDCSGDGTLERIRRATDGYAGPHRLVVTQTLVNRGTVSHLAEAGQLLTGDLVLLGAGDDISLPQRVSKTVADWQASGWDASFGHYHLINESGTIVRHDYRFDDRGVPLRTYFRRDPPINIHGASSAYTKRVFAWLGEGLEGVLFEDSYMSFLLGLRGGRIGEIDAPLVLYRQHGASITNFAFAATDGAALDEQERRGAVAARSVATMLAAFERAAQSEGGDRIDLARIRADRQFYEVRAAWAGMSLPQRLAALSRHNGAGQRHWMAPRMAGPAGLRIAKKLRNLLAR